MWVAYSYSLYFSEQLSCIKYFHLTYGLKDINFQSFNQFITISGISEIYLIIKLELSKTVLLTGSTDIGGPHVSHTVNKSIYFN